MSRAAELHDVGRVGGARRDPAEAGAVDEGGSENMRQDTLSVSGSSPPPPRSRRSPARALRAMSAGTAGLPDELAGDHIPLGARIVAACDAFKAMTTDAPTGSRSPARSARGVRPAPARSSTRGWSASSATLSPPGSTSSASPAPPTTSPRSWRRRHERAPRTPNRRPCGRALRARSGHRIRRDGFGRRAHHDRHRERWAGEQHHHLAFRAQLPRDGDGHGRDARPGRGLQRRRRRERRCPVAGITAISASLGDLDDVITNSTSFAATLNGNSEDDTLNGDTRLDTLNGGTGRDATPAPPRTR